jgi:hypothetical protein
VAEFDIMYNEGISREGGLLDVGIAAGILSKTGAWFNYGDMRLGQGRENARDFLKQKPEVAERIDDEIRGKVASIEVGPEGSARPSRERAPRAGTSSGKRGAAQDLNRPSLRPRSRSRCAIWGLVRGRGGRSTGGSDARGRRQRDRGVLDRLTQRAISTTPRSHGGGASSGTDTGHAASDDRGPNCASTVVPREVVEAYRAEHATPERGPRTRDCPRARPSVRATPSSVTCAAAAAGGSEGKAEDRDGTSCGADSTPTSCAARSEWRARRRGTRYPETHTTARDSTAVLQPRDDS